jgi:hypothetical protein
MQEPFIFSRNPYVTEPEVWSWAADIEHGRETGKKPLIEKFIRHRLEHRYIEPLKGAKSGFLIMAVSCLLIETLQSFLEGWDDSDGKSKTAFDDFFRLNADLFPNFKNSFPMVPHPKKPGKNIGAFYLHIRCGILHQAETTGDYSIVRDETPFSQRSASTPMNS